MLKSVGVAESPSLAADPARQAPLRDLVILTKPRITMMVLITVAGGLFLSRRASEATALSPGLVLSTLLGSAFIVAGANALYFTMFDEVWVLKAGEDAPMQAKVAAGSAVVLWVAIMWCGNMLPFIGDSF